MADRTGRAKWQRKQLEPRTSRATPVPAFNMEKYARESDQGMLAAEEEPTRPRGMEHSDVHDVAAPALEVAEWVSDAEAEEVYWAHIGDRSRVPVLARPLDQLLSEPRAPGDAVVLAAIDGASSVETIVEACGVPPLVALQVVCDLLDRRVIRFAAG